MDIWMIAFFLAYASLGVVIYKAYLQRLILQLRNMGWYYHYHVIDTGESGDMVFCAGVNDVNGVSRTFDRTCIYNGTVFYEANNAEPLKMKRDEGTEKGGEYKYFCNTKNFHSVAKNDVLETLLILRAKDMIIVLIMAVIVVAVLGAVANVYTTNSSAAAIQNTLEIIKNQTAQQTGIVGG
jgi:hypothetical protein